MNNKSTEAKEKALEIYRHFQAIIPHQNNRLTLVLQCSLVVAEECLKDWTIIKNAESLAILGGVNCQFWEEVIVELKEI